MAIQHKTTLLVLGNGFDLAAGLGSSYLPFFESMGIYGQDSKTAEQNRKKTKPSQMENVWQMLFYFANLIEDQTINRRLFSFEIEEETPWNMSKTWIKNANWASVENFIKFVVTDSVFFNLLYCFQVLKVLNPSLDFTGPTLIQRMDDEIENYKHIDINDSDELNKAKQSLKKLLSISGLYMSDELYKQFIGSLVLMDDKYYFYGLSIIADFLFSRISRNDSSYNYAVVRGSISKINERRILFELYTELLNELQAFENNFKNYILNQLKINIDYYKNAHILLHQLVNSNDYDEANSLKVLNFNYTNPFTNSDEILTLNIHGDLNTHTIFGIDEQSIKEFLDKDKNPFNKNGVLSPVRKFSKTSRIINTPGILKENGDNLFEGINNIVFFGHSLGEADYSYFMSIFDRVDLYDSDTRLIFKYYDYDGKGDKVHRLEQTHAAERLLTKYAETLSNDHGDSLLHKLALEQRIEFTSIQGIP